MKSLTTWKALAALVSSTILLTFTDLAYSQESAAGPAAAETPVETVNPATAPDAAPPEESKDLVVPGVALTKRFAQGGLTMYALLGLSFIMVTFGVERFVHLRRKRIAPDGLTDDARKAWRTGSMENVINTARQKPSVLASAIEVLARHPHVAGSDASTMAGDEVSRLMRRHLQRAYPLAIVATLSPLLGLLGTVTGMIDAFEVVAIAGSLGDASLLAAGIAKALITTAFGLIVAIPALGLYHYFRSKTHELSLEVEEEVDQLLSEWFHPAVTTPSAHQEPASAA